MGRIEEGRVLRRFSFGGGIKRVEAGPFPFNVS